MILKPKSDFSYIKTALRITNKTPSSSTTIKSSIYLLFNW